jgi:hypothetical protein
VVTIYYIPFKYTHFNPSNMLGLTILSAFLALISLASSTSILVPLYVWPEDDSTWEPVFNAISSYPDVQFQVIVNPNSGPGDTGRAEDIFMSEIMHSDHPYSLS